MTSFRVLRRMEFCETDLAGIVHFANFYRFMEQAEHEFFRSLGLKIAGTIADGTPYGWPRVAAACKFRAPAFYEDILEITLEIQDRTSRSLTISYRLTRGETLIAEGEMTTVFCLIPPGERPRSADIPPEIVATLDQARGILGAS